MSAGEWAGEGLNYDLNDYLMDYDWALKS